MSKAKWFELLAEGDNSVNIERVDKVQDIKTGLRTLEYVLNTIEVFHEYDNSDIPEIYRDCILEALKWSEVSKCGSKERRAKWQDDYDLSIHNLASAKIYMDYAECPNATTAALIEIHGTLGQYMRGEVCNIELNRIIDFIKTNEETGIPVETSIEMVRILTFCVVMGLPNGSTIWDDICLGIEDALSSFQKGVLPVNDVETRISRIKSDFSSWDLITDDFRRMFNAFTFWYAESALAMFPDNVFIKIIELAINMKSNHEICVDLHDISFKKLADIMYYDYDNGSGMRKHVNIYKQRIIEAYTNERTTKHISVDSPYCGTNILMFTFSFSKTADKLIDFCIEAELENDISCHQAISMLYSLFGWKKDKFDRLNAEDKYLETMNNSSDNSGKKGILDFVVGESVLDVGSGGGVLLKELSERFPNKTIYGTDISLDVMNKLFSISTKDGYGWNLSTHNFVEGPFKLDTNEKVNNIIFSSILHEIYSYTEPHFSIESVKSALRNAYESLAAGGRLIIRDGVMEECEKDVVVRLLGHEGKDFFKNYLSDFKGLKDYDRNKISYNEDEDGVVVNADINYIREMIYTYTWGAESYDMEVQEQFGYWTLSQFVDFLKNELHANVIFSQKYYDPAYESHLKDKITIDKYPATTLVIVAEKPNI